MRLPCLAFSSTSSLHGLARSRDYTLSSFSRRSTFHNSAPVSLFVFWRVGGLSSTTELMQWKGKYYRGRRRVRKQRNVSKALPSDFLCKWFAERGRVNSPWRASQGIKPKTLLHLLFEPMNTSSMYMHCLNQDTGVDKPPRSTEQICWQSPKYTHNDPRRLPHSKLKLRGAESRVGVFSIATVGAGWARGSWSHRSTELLRSLVRRLCGRSGQTPPEVDKLYSTLILR